MSKLVSLIKPPLRTSTSHTKSQQLCFGFKFLLVHPSRQQSAQGKLGCHPRLLEFAWPSSRCCTRLLLVHVFTEQSLSFLEYNPYIYKRNSAKHCHVMPPSTSHISCSIGLLYDAHTMTKSPNGSQNHMLITDWSMTVFILSSVLFMTF